MWGSHHPHRKGTARYTLEALQHTFHVWNEVDLRRVFAVTNAEFYDLDLTTLEAIPIGPAVSHFALTLSKKPSDTLSMALSERRHSV